MALKYGGTMDDKADVNLYVKNIIVNYKYRRKEYKKFITNEYKLNDLTGVLSSFSAELLIKKAIVNKKISVFTHSLLEYCDSNTITYSLINLLKKLPRTKQYSYCSTMIHCNLSFTQMWQINNIVGTEAFQDLFISICENNLFTEMDMCMLLDNDNYSDEMLNYCISLCEKQFGKSKKTEIAKKYTQ